MRGDYRVAGMFLWAYLSLIVAFFIVLSGCAPQAVSDNSVCPPPKVYSCADVGHAEEVGSRDPVVDQFLRDYSTERHVLAACRKEPPPKCAP